MKIAKAELFGAIHITDWDEWKEKDDDWVRTSEVVDVKFVDLPAKEVVPLKIAIIDKGIECLRAELGEKIARLEDEKAKLLAITHESE